MPLWLAAQLSAFLWDTHRRALSLIDAEADEQIMCPLGHAGEEGRPPLVGCLSSVFYIFKMCLLTDLSLLRVFMPTVVLALLKFG